MSDHHRVPSPDLFQSFYKEGGLGAWSPDARARPLGISEPGTIKAQDTIAPGKKINEAADREVLDHRPIAVEKNHARGSRVSPLPIVHADSVALDEFPRRWIFSFCYEGEHKVPNHQKNQDNDKNGENGGDRGHIPSLDSTGSVNIRRFAARRRADAPVNGSWRSIVPVRMGFRGQENPAEETLAYASGRPANTRAG
jgi:hypothetical protein